MRMAPPPHAHLIVLCEHFKCTDNKQYNLLSSGFAPKFQELENGNVIVTYDSQSDRRPGRPPHRENRSLKVLFAPWGGLPCMRSFTAGLKGLKQRTASITKPAKSLIKYNCLLCFPSPNSLMHIHHLNYSSKKTSTTNYATLLILYMPGIFLHNY